MEYYIVKPPYAEIKEYCIEHKIAVMLSYWSDKNCAYKEFLQPRKERMEKGLENGKLFMDSGAFTAWTKGAVIDVDEYCDYINENGQYVDYFGQLDRIPRVGATMKEAEEAAKYTLDNYLDMVSKVKYPEKIVYTFHVGEPIEILKQALKWGSEHKDIMQLIAIGGMVRKNAVSKHSIINRVFAAIREIYPEVKVHLFGCTSPQYFIDYPATSGDSSNYIMSAKTGCVWTPNGTFLFGDKKDKNHYSVQRDDVKEVIDKYLSEIGTSAEEVMSHPRYRLLANVKYIEREFYFKKIENKNRVIFKKLF